MVKIGSIPEVTQRFINRKRLNEIKERIGRIPPGNYKAKKNVVFVHYLDEKGEEEGSISVVANIHFPGALDAFLHMKQDIEDLVRHVENADIENDVLLEKLELRNQIQEEPWK